ncbi:hypothetical protein SBOR_9758 [Sclerotinia borealis F-4128]|uniref:Uncharacterized protein n=1 Tax=Sclerotinia borealis (strain F-4128) TaxID=1432307 RepID=W9BZ76_SCLBF|nr:hypothetical protein SBOR_9758 [Sclerotinia borealis F-4128]
MTSNKHKKSTPQKSPQKSSPHKPHEQHKSHKSPQKKVAPLKTLPKPILPQKHAGVARPILPPTRRLLFLQNSNQSNKQPFSSPPPVKKDHLKTKKHTLSSPATKLSDDRPFKKQRLSSPSPAKRSKIVTTEQTKVERENMSTPSDDDEDEDENEDSTPSPPSRKGKANTNRGAPGSHKKTSLSVAIPPKAAVSVVIPAKQYPPSPFSTIQPNSMAINKIDISVLRLEKEELQKRLDASVQQVRDLKYDARNWEDRFKTAENANHVLRKNMNADARHHKEVTATAGSVLHECDTLNQNNAKLKQELLACKAKNKKDMDQQGETHKQNLELANKLNHKLKLSETDRRHLETKVALLEEDLRRWHRAEIENIKAPPSEKNRLALLGKQIAQLSENKEELSHQVTQLNKDKEELTHQITHLQHQLQHKEALTFQINQLHEDIQFKDDLASQATRTHALETEALVQQITHLKSRLQDQSLITQEIHNLREEILDKNEEIDILSEDQRKLVNEAAQGQHLNRQKDVGLEKMGLLVAGWTMKWRALGYGDAGEGADGDADGDGMGGKIKIPGVQGMAVCVNGVRMD